MKNIILDTDSYKTSHYLQYPPGTEYVSSYIEARGGDYPVIFFGLQMWLMNLPLLTQDDIEEADQILNMHGVPFNRNGWERLLQKHQGKLPVRIQALPEGTVTRPGIPLVQITNTDPEFPWLTSYLETSLLRAIWYPTTVATISGVCKNVISSYLKDTADDPEAEIPFKLHDFGARGVSSSESAAIGGLAHLVNFHGTDTVEAILAAKKYYGEPMAGFSIPASEHSTITTWGGPDKEADAYRNMIDQFGKPGKIFACVSDSYDIYRSVDWLWGTLFKDKLQKMGNAGATLVIRPDSGDPVDLVPDLIQRLMAHHGYTTNKKGYKVLPPYLRMIQGDGVNIGSINNILYAMKARGLSASNIAFGMGGALLQKVDRDTLKFAMKANQITINGIEYPVYKQPIGDSSKNSKPWRQAVISSPLGHHSINEQDCGSGNLLTTVFEDGRLLKITTLQEVRDRASGRTN